MFSTINEFKSSDTNVSKFVFTKEDCAVEAVLYKYESYEERTVICCSTMSGCPIGCRFCGTGDYYVRNLTSEEIVFQVKYMLDEKKIISENIKRFQIMFMSMGEPMLNFKELKKAIEQLHVMYSNASLLISTSAPKVDYSGVIELSKNISKVGLQFSVHESTDEARNKLIPFKNKLSLEEIGEVGLEWFNATGRKPFFNYCANQNNTTDQDVKRLDWLFSPEVFECTISVICERGESVAAANKRQEELAYDFSQKMLKCGYGVRTFNPAGQDDIGGGCGQLWFVQKWMKENPDKAKPSIGFGKPQVHTPR